MARRQEPSECMAFSPDDTWIACGAGNATTYDGMQLSCVQTGQLLGRQKIVSSVTLSLGARMTQMFESGTHKLAWGCTSHCRPSHIHRIFSRWMLHNFRIRRPRSTGHTKASKLGCVGRSPASMRSREYHIFISRHVGTQAQKRIISKLPLWFHHRNWYVHRTDKL